MKKIELNIECPSCGGTGLYSGMAEGKGVAVICGNCSGTGEYSYSYSYKEFKGRNEKPGIERVFKKGSRYVLGLGVVNYDGIGKIDMDKEGVSYQEFLSGKMPEHIETMECPMMADQGECHAKKGFVEKCNELHGGWIGYIPECKNKENKDECWKRFKDAA